MAIAAVIFIPLAFFSIKSIFDSVYPYHIPVKGGFFILAFGVMIVVAAMTMSTLIYRAVMANPVKSLRTE